MGNKGNSVSKLKLDGMAARINSDAPYCLKVERSRGQPPLLMVNAATVNSFDRLCELRASFPASEIRVFIPPVAC